MASIRYLSPQWTPESAEARDILYPAIRSGLTGQGLTPAITARTRRDMLAATREQFYTGGRELESFASRNVPRQDIKVRQYMKDALASQYAGQREDINRDYTMTRYDDVSRAQNLGFGALASEKSQSATLADMANQATMQQMNAPDKQSQLMGGIGGALGIFAGAGGFQGLFGRGGTTPLSTLAGGGQGGYQATPGSTSAFGYQSPAKNFAYNFSGAYKTGMTPQY